MRFDKYIPCPALQFYVKHLAVSEQEQGQAYKVLPGTSVVLGFQYRGSLSRINLAEQPLSISGITGLQDSYTVFKNSPNTGTILVYFTETGASHFFNIPVNEIFSESLSLDTFIPRSALEAIEGQLAEAGTDRKRIAIVEQFLLSQLRPGAIDKLVAEAVNLITASNGTLRINDLTQKLYISQSPLEKRFRRIVGTTPKKFSSLIRLQSVISSGGESRSLTDLGYAAGYFDQAHFIKDFRQFTGETPEAFFKKEK